MMFWAKNFRSHFFYLYVRFGDMYVYINILVTEILFMPKGCGVFWLCFCVSANPGTVCLLQSCPLLVFVALGRLFST